MIIDTHIHCFADKIAKKAADTLIKRANIPTYTDFTESGTRQKLAEWDVDYGIVLPIATKPEQQRTINNWAAYVQNGRLMAFGTIHPDSPTVLEELEYISDCGLKGIKLHPDYQNFFINEVKMYPIYKKISELGLPAVFHVGYDPVSPNTAHATPHTVRQIADMFPDLTIIAAHLGGLYYGDECEKWLVGAKNVYFDLAMTNERRTDDEVYRIISSHGTDRILFASDCPWYHPLTTLDRLKRLPLTRLQLDDILWKNAAKLLHINFGKI